ncbi:MAG: HEAT repeat domain-containing protein [Clostridiales bacterium]|jgi:HEAT repeat protein|nr:HEAT repeat domain-containing protein [Clostridiales bacterium]
MDDEVRERGGSGEETLGKLYELEKQKELSLEDVALLGEMANADSGEVRSITAGILARSESALARATLVKLSHDGDALVRVNACDSLSNFTDDEIVGLLKQKVAKDTNALVRSYALIALSDILPRMDDEKEVQLRFFEGMLKKARNVRDKITCYKALYRLGKTEFLNKILEEVSGVRYQNRCFAINTLLEIANSENQVLMLKCLKEQRKKEKTVAVQSTIDRAVSELKQLIECKRG